MAERSAAAGSSRLAALRERLAEARADNLDAVAEEGRRPRQRERPSVADDDAENGLQGEGESSPSGSAKKGRRKRKRVGAGGGDDEPDELVSKAMRGRVERMRRSSMLANGLDVSSSGADGNDTGVAMAAYGGKGTLAPGAADRVANELADVERRRQKSKKVAEFDEEGADIGFINEPNRRFNAMLDKHFDKYDIVREVKESLERGTALP